jgi:hypothetical protein
VPRELIAIIGQAEPSDSTDRQSVGESSSAGCRRPSTGVVAGGSLSFPSRRGDGFRSGRQCGQEVATQAPLGTGSVRGWFELEQ